MLEHNLNMQIFSASTNWLFFFLVFCLCSCHGRMDDVRIDFLVLMLMLLLLLPLLIVMRKLENFVCHFFFCFLSLFILEKCFDKSWRSNVEIYCIYVCVCFFLSSSLCWQPSATAAASQMYCEMYYEWKPHAHTSPPLPLCILYAILFRGKYIPFWHLLVSATPHKRPSDRDGRSIKAEK